MVRFTYYLSQSNPIFHLCIFSFGLLKDLSTNIPHKSYKELGMCTCMCVCMYAQLLKKVLIKEESHHSYSSNPSSRSLPLLQAPVYVLTYSSSTSSIPVEIFITFSCFHGRFLLVLSFMPNTALVGRLILSRICYCFCFWSCSLFCIVSGRSMELYWEKFDFCNQRTWVWVLALLNLSFLIYKMEIIFSIIILVWLWIKKHGNSFVRLCTCGKHVEAH